MIEEHLKNRFEQYSHSRSFSMNFGAMAAFCMAPNLVTATMAVPVVRKSTSSSVHESYAQSGMHIKENHIEIGEKIEIKPELENHEHLTVRDTAPISSIGSIMAGVQEIKENWEEIREVHTIKKIHDKMDEIEASVNSEIEHEERVVHDAKPEEFKAKTPEVQPEEPKLAELSKDEIPVKVDERLLEQLGYGYLAQDIGAQGFASESQLAYESYISYNLRKAGENPGNDSYLRKARVAIDNYAAEHPEQARLFGLSLLTIGQTVTAITAVGAGAAAAPVGAGVGTIFAISAGAYYVLDKINDKVGEYIDSTINAVSDLAARYQAKNADEYSSLHADYSFLGNALFLGFLATKKGGKAAVAERVALHERMAEIKTFLKDVKVDKIEFEWNPRLGKGGCGIAYENYLETLKEFAGTRLPANFKTFDFWRQEDGIATSVKTLNTNAKTYTSNPSKIYSKIKGYVDKTLKFDGDRRAFKKGEKPVVVLPDEINVRNVYIGIPENTSMWQMNEIMKAVEYGKTNNVNVIIRKVGK